MTNRLFRASNEPIERALRDRLVPWHGTHGFPRNVTSRRRYDGYNALLLTAASVRYKFLSRFWGTKEEWESLGGRLQPDARCVNAVLYRSGFYGFGGGLVRFCVYNLDQVEGSFVASRHPLPPVDYAKVESVVTKVGADIRYTDENVAEYHWKDDDGDGDYIKMCHMRHFVRGPEGLPGYYYALFHELAGHFTEPQCRAGFWSHSEINELRADMASGFVASELAIPPVAYENRKHHQSLAETWGERIAKRPKMLYDVALSAAKGVDFILGCSGPVEPRHRLTGDESA
jgi:antirestriction protein ArdC